MNTRIMTKEIELRPEVQWFAEQMELQLRANDEKPGWADDAIWSLIDRIQDEHFELWREYAKLGSRLVPNGPQLVIKEAADIANFAMMVADNVRRLGTVPVPQKRCVCPENNCNGDGNTGRILLQPFPNTAVLEHCPCDGHSEYVEGHPSPGE